MLLDIANHIIASENYRFRKDNADGFVVLVEAGCAARRQRAVGLTSACGQP